MKAHTFWCAALATLAAPLLTCQAALADTAAISAPVAVAAPHQRVLPLQGGRNFRDLGGYATADGHHVKWGLLFRSGSMHGLTAADYAYLEGRGIRVVCDFRSTGERTAEAVNWPADRAPTVLADDYSLMQSGAMPKGDMRSWDADQAMLGYFAPQYRRMFAELLAGHAPLAFNCSAGKDRTGVAAALLLTALGVPRETVIEDYLLTNQTLDQSQLIKGQSSGTAKLGGGMPSPVIAAFLTADRSYIEAALAAMESHPGGSMGYLRDEMQLSPQDIARLRRLYLD